jgi:division protein CdvB (Snf7/Vps24/ESCRT-III family)
MKLIDYPAEIAEKQRQLLRIEQHIHRLQEILNRLTAEIEIDVNLLRNQFSVLQRLLIE